MHSQRLLRRLDVLHWRMAVCQEWVLEASSSFVTFRRVWLDRRYFHFAFQVAAHSTNFSSPEDWSQLHFKVCDRVYKINIFFSVWLQSRHFKNSVHSPRRPFLLAYTADSRPLWFLCISRCSAAIALFLFTLFDWFSCFLMSSINGSSISFYLSKN